MILYFQSVVIVLRCYGYNNEVEFEDIFITDFSRHDGISIWEIWNKIPKDYVTVKIGSKFFKSVQCIKADIAHTHSL